VSGADAELDYRGQRCPAPIVALGRASRSTPGVVVELLADDPAAEFDVPAWCRLRGATLLSAVEAGGADTATWRVFVIRLPEA